MGEALPFEVGLRWRWWYAMCWASASGPKARLTPVLKYPTASRACQAGAGALVVRGRFPKRAIEQD